MDATEKLFKRAVSRSQSPHSFGTLLSNESVLVRPKVIRAGRRLSFDELQHVKCHVSYHAHPDHGLPIWCALDVVKGFGLGFCSWVLPVSIFYRRVSGLRRGVAIGAFFGSFRLVSCSLFRLLNATSKTGSKWHDFIYRFVNAISGFCSGALFSALDADVRNAVFVLWIVIRALRAVLPAVPYGDVVLMMLSASNILSTYVHHPSDNTDSYAAFLHKFGGKTAAQLAPHRGDGRHSLPLCPGIHPGQSCSAHFVTFTADGLLRAVPLYVPVHLVGFALNSHRSVTQLLSNVLRSSLFLSLYCSSAWFSACLYYRANPFVSRTSRLATLLPELLPGLAVLVERPSRRRELASYCLSHALNAAWSAARRRFGFRPRNWVSVTLLAFAFGTLLQHFEEQPNAITSVFFGIQEFPVVINARGKGIRFSQESIKKLP